MVDINLNEEQSNGMLGTSQEQNLHDSTKYILEENQQLKEDLQDSLNEVLSVKNSQVELRKNWRSSIDAMIAQFEQATGEKYYQDLDFDVDAITEDILYDLNSYDFEIGTINMETENWNDQITINANYEIDRDDYEQVVEKIVRLTIKSIGGSNE